MSSNSFKIELRKPVCIQSISEDSLRELVDALQVTLKDDTFSGFVLSSGGTSVRFVFGPDGNFQGVVAKVGGKDITLIEGANSSSLGIFKGAPSGTNPGPGWEVEAELTQQYLSQPMNQNDWNIFYASRVSVINI